MERKTEYLADLAESIWESQAKQRRLKMWLSELNSKMKSVLRSMDKQEEEMLAAIRRGTVDEETMADAEDSIQERKAEVASLGERFRDWGEGAEIDLIEVKGTLFDPEVNPEAEGEIKKAESKRGGKGKSAPKKVIENDDDDDDVEVGGTVSPETLEAVRQKLMPKGVKK